MKQQEEFYNFNSESYVRRKVEIFNDSFGDYNNDYDCPICRNKGIVMVAYNDNGNWGTKVRDCDCAKIISARKNLKNSGLASIVDEYRFDNFNTDHVWQAKLKKAAENFAAAPEGWFFLGGQSGAGKTHICTAICDTLLKKGMAVTYCLWRTESIKIKGHINDPEIYCELVDNYKKVDVLYVDDLFKLANNSQGPSAADIGVAFEILNYRYINRLTTIISTEFSIDDIIRFDEAIGGRIAEMAKNHLIVIGPDRQKNYRLRNVNFV